MRLEKLAVDRATDIAILNRASRAPEPIRTAAGSEACPPGLTGVGAAGFSVFGVVPLQGAASTLPAA